MCGATARTGFCAPARSVALGLLAVVCWSTTATARDTKVEIPATSLDQALAALARQTGADVISIEPGLRQVRSRAVSGTFSTRRALDRLLQGSGYRAVAVDARSYRVVRAPAPPVVPVRVARPRPVQVPAHSPRAASAEVVVTASKQRVPLLRYPGSLIVIDNHRWPLSVPDTDVTDLAQATPVLQTTDLGPGRDKVFVRGIADSSFNGASQSTASVYLGDVQVGYSEQDPDLKLYDIKEVQVLEGPQGTLYGSGAIGGIIRIIPNPVDLARVSGSIAEGVSATTGGAPGFDASGMLDLPIVTDRLGVRAVAYRSREGGYVDDPGRGLSDINRVDTVGGRLAGRWSPGGGWQIDATGAYQRIDARDAPYVEPSVGPLARRAAFAEPFDSQVGLGSISVSKSWTSGLHLLSVTGAATYHSADLFDATPAQGPGAPPTAYQTDGSRLLLTQETRLSRSLPSGSSWVVGVALLQNRDGESRALGPVGQEADIIGVTNLTRTVAAFGEATWAVLPSVSLTGGGRVTIARTDGEPSFSPKGGSYVAGRTSRRVDPTAAIDWKLAPTLAVYARVQSGFRTGGLAVARGVGRVADFDADSIRVGEVGVRRLHTGETGVSFTGGVSIAQWHNIQADLVNRRGLPYTVNLGDARIIAVEGTVDWTPIRGLRASGSFLYTSNRITGAIAMLSSPAHRRLPETPPLAASLDGSYEWRVGHGDALSLGGSATRVGRSVLGTGDLLDISQGRYTTIGARAGWRRGRVQWSLTGENLANTHANLFAFGNPFALASRDLATPLRPRTIRLGTALAW